MGCTEPGPPSAMGRCPRHFHHGFLTLSGGAEDAYTYCIRGQVFANAQTGNIVLMSQRAFAGDLAGVLRYLIPLLAFALGVFAAEMVRRRCQEISRLHWRQMVVLAEIGLLLGVGFLPSSWDAPANALVSFTCAMQVQAFRKVNGSAYASTMCIGNLRSGVDLPSAAYVGPTRDRTALRKAGRYFAVILDFALGPDSAALPPSSWGTGAIWASCLLLAVSFLLMFRQEIQAEADC